MIKNILPSILATAVSDISIKTIRRALKSFIPGPEFTPGRMNIFKFRDFTVMLDYVHNTDGFDELKLFMEKINSPYKIGIIGCAGDRRDDDIRYMGKVSAEIFDEIIIRHDKDCRGRTREELTRLISEGIEIIKPGLNIKIISNEIDAFDQAAQSAPKNAFIMVACDKVPESIQYLEMKLKQQSTSMAYEL